MDALVSTEWLAARVGSPDLRVFDTAVAYRDGGIHSGKARYERGHIPGAGFLDLTGPLSDHSADVILQQPGADALRSLFGDAGIGDHSQVVLYSSDHIMWATSVWWMLHAIGFPTKAVLDGGLSAWLDEGRPVETGTSTCPPARLTIGRSRDELWSDKYQVAAALDDARAVVACALRREVYEGTAPEHYGRPGHISGSVAVPHPLIVDPDTNRFRDEQSLRRAFAEAGVLDSDRVIVYCGGGIAATVDAFALHLLGHRGTSVYDGSLLQWLKDADAPMAVGPDP